METHVVTRIFTIHTRANERAVAVCDLVIRKLRELRTRASGSDRYYLLPWLSATVATAVAADLEYLCADFKPGGNRRKVVLHVKPVIEFDVN